MRSIIDRLLDWIGWLQSESLYRFYYDINKVTKQQLLQVQTGNRKDFLGFLVGNIIAIP